MTVSPSDWVQIALGMGGVGLTLLGALVLNVAQLNKNIAVILVKMESYEDRLDKLERVTVPCGHS